MAIPLSMVDGLTLLDGSASLEVWPSGGEVWLTDLDLGHPEVRSAVVPRTQANGTKDYTQNYGARTIALSLRIIPQDGRSIQAVLDDLKSWTDPARRPTLLYAPTGAPEREFTLRNSGFSGAFSMQGFHQNTVTAQLQFVCPDGRGFGTDEESIDVEVNDGSGGRIYNLVYNRNYQMDPDPWESVTGGGNTDSFPVIKIYGPVQNPGIFNDTTGLGLEFDGLTVNDGDYIEIDTDAKSVKLNGLSGAENNMRRYLTTRQWWTVQRGINSFRLTGVVSGDAHAEVSWRPAWL